MVSAHRGLYSLGAVLTIGVGACLFVSLVTMPALLTTISRHRAALTGNIDGTDPGLPEEVTAPSAAKADEPPRGPVVVHEPAQVA